MVDLLFSAIPNKVDPLLTVDLQQSCHDFKVFTSDQCNNKMDEMGCGPFIRARGGKVEYGKAFVPEVWSNGKYHPICGHFFWDNSHGAETVCKRLGLTEGKGEVIQTRNVYDQDAMPVGKCNAGEPLYKCTAGGNAFGDLNDRAGYCKTGESVGIQVVCRQRAPEAESYDPCKDRREGSACRACPPDLKDCLESAVLKTCQKGKCRPSSSGGIPMFRLRRRKL